MSKKKIIGISLLAVAAIIVLVVAILRWCDVRIFYDLINRLEDLMVAFFITLPITIFFIVAGIILLVKGSKKDVPQNNHVVNDNTPKKICPSCNTPNEMQAQYCKKCGNKLN